MIPLLDPRNGDSEDDASSTTQRSMLSLAGSLLAEISLPKLVVTWMLSATNDPVSPAWYIVVTSAISLVAMAMLPETRDVDVSK